MPHDHSYMTPSSDRTMRACGTSPLFDGNNLSASLTFSVYLCARGRKTGDRNRR